MPIVVYWHKQEDVKAKSGLASGFSALHHYTTFEMVSCAAHDARREGESVLYHPLQRRRTFSGRARHPPSNPGRSGPIFARLGYPCQFVAPAPSETPAHGVRATRCSSARHFTKMTGDLLAFLLDIR